MFSLVHYAFQTLPHFDFPLTALRALSATAHAQSSSSHSSSRSVVDDSFEDVAEDKDSNGENILASERPGLR